MFYNALTATVANPMVPQSVNMNRVVGFKHAGNTDVKVSSLLQRIIDFATDSQIIWAVAGFMILVGIVLYVLGKTFPNVLMSGVKLIINVIIGIVLTIVGVEIAKIIIGMFLEAKP